MWAFYYSRDIFWLI